MSSTTLSIYERFTCRAYSSCFMHAIVAHMRLRFFKVFSNFVHFCSIFRMFCPFCPFFRPCLGFANFYHYQKTKKKFSNLNEQCFFPSMQLGVGILYTLFEKSLQFVTRKPVWLAPQVYEIRKTVLLNSMEKGQEPFENQEYECLRGHIRYLFKHFKMLVWGTL